MSADTPVVSAPPPPLLKVLRNLRRDLLAASQRSGEVVREPPGCEAARTRRHGLIHALTDPRAPSTTSASGRRSCTGCGDGPVRPGGDDQGDRHGCRPARARRFDAAVDARLRGAQPAGTGGEGGSVGLDGLAGGGSRWRAAELGLHGPARAGLRMLCLVRRSRLRRGGDIVAVRGRTGQRGSSSPGAPRRVASWQGA